MASCAVTVSNAARRRYTELEMLAEGLYGEARVERRPVAGLRPIRIDRACNPIARDPGYGRPRQRALTFRVFFMACSRDTTIPLRIDGRAAAQARPAGAAALPSRRRRWIAGD
jgi:hypothetical protein